MDRSKFRLTYSTLAFAGLLLAQNSIYAQAEKTETAYNLSQVFEDDQPGSFINYETTETAEAQFVSLENSCSQNECTSSCVAGISCGCESCTESILDRLTLADGLKNIPISFLGCDAWISLSGELRYRYIDEADRLRPGGPGRSTYNQWRWRNNIDLHLTDNLSGRVSVMDASTFDHELPLTPIDMNRTDIYSAYFDYQLPEFTGRNVTFRYGRQDLLYGSQRLISPLDWAITRRNFEGFKLFSKGETWDIDAFATRPVNTAAGNGTLARYDRQRDHADASRTFSGVWATNHGMENSLVDAYWLWDRETDFKATGLEYSRHTVGTRFTHDRPLLDECCEASRVFHVDVEGGYHTSSEITMANPSKPVSSLRELA